MASNGREFPIGLLLLAVAFVTMTLMRDFVKPDAHSAERKLKKRESQDDTQPPCKDL